MHVQSLFFSKICESGPDIYNSETSEAASRKLGGSLTDLALQSLGFIWNQFKPN